MKAKTVKPKLKTYRVRAEYRCKVHTDVEAHDEAEAERIALPELDQDASHNLSCYDLTVEEKG